MTCGSDGASRYHVPPTTGDRALNPVTTRLSSQKAMPAGSTSPYQPKHKIRLVTATSLFDGHDASIHIFRRIAQATGAEVIHLGHNRSVQEIVEAAIAEDAQGIAVTSYQGGHNEFFRFLHDMLNARGAGHVRIFGGGGGVILPDETAALHAYGIACIYSPDDGRRLGLQGMIDDMLQRCDFATVQSGATLPTLAASDPFAVARAITQIETEPDATATSYNFDWRAWLASRPCSASPAPAARARVR